MNGPFATASEPTYLISELCGEIREVFSQAFRSIWVRGEVQRVKASRNGHLYFELIEKDAADGIVARLDAVVWRNDHARIRRQLSSGGEQLAEGVEIRCRGRVDFWPPGGRLQLVVEEVDPVFSLGLLEQRRRQTLEALARAGLLERNRALPLAELPLRVGLVTSAGSAAYHDFVSTLEESGYGFQVLLVHAAVQGKVAEREVAAALATLAALRERLDCIALVRGGGARSDLAVFDSRAVAEAVARSPLPVLSGLGHEIDQSLCDRVAHTPLKTPTKVAEFLVERLAIADGELQQLRHRLLREAREPLRRGVLAVERAARALRLAGVRLAAQDRHLDELGRLLARVAAGRVRRGRERSGQLSRQLATAAPRLLAAGRQRPRQVQQQILAHARGRLAQARATLEGLSRLCVELSPQRTLERGFSITRNDRGELLRSAALVAPGEVLVTELLRGTVRSRVETTE